MTTPAALQPPSVLLAGPTGTGKTTSLATLAKAGIETFVITTEPGGAESLIDGCERIGAPLDKMHWASCPPASAGWNAFDDLISKISMMDQKGISDIRDLGKADARPAAMRLLGHLKDFSCERTNQNYGSFTSWDHTRCLVVDSLTGLSMIGFALTVGYKPTANPGEWGIAQNFIHSLLVKINADRKCFFVLTAHVEKESDELTGVKKLMVSTIGAKLAPKIPPFFSEVVLTSRNPFQWSTLDSGMDLKNRALPVSAKLEPDFKLVVDAYRRRLGKVSGSPQPATTSAVA